MSATLSNDWRRFLQSLIAPVLRLSRRARKATQRCAIFRLEELESRVTPTTSVAPNVAITNYRLGMTGVNPNETVLTPTNVNSSSFGKVWDNEQIVGQVYAQPLYLPNLSVTVNGQTTTQNTLLVATEANMLYWINADTGAIVQSVDFDNYGLPAATSVIPVPSEDVGEGLLNGFATSNTQIYPEMGITSAPLFANGQLYLVASKKELVAGDSLIHYVFDLEVVNVATGAVSQTQISNTGWDGTNYTFFPGDPFVPGNGDGSVNGDVYFNARMEANRPAVTLVADTAGNQDIVLSFAGHDDTDPYHGWVIAYNASTLQVVGTFCTTPNGSEGGIWRSPITDGQGDLWFVDGNGTFDTQLAGNGQPSSGDYGDSVIHLQLTPNGFTVADYFTPSDQQFLSDNDLDLDAGGLVAIPDAQGNLSSLVSIGKDGTIYLLNPSNLGGFNAGGDQVIQELPNIIPRFEGEADFCESTFFDNTLFVFGQHDKGEAFAYTPNAAQPLATTPSSLTGQFYGYPGAVPAVSANGTQDALLWTLNGVTGLEAYNASPTGLSTLLYASGQHAIRDQPPGYVKFTTPVVVNGHVFVAGNGGVAAYGLLNGGSGGTGGGSTASVPAPSGVVATLDPIFTWKAVTGVSTYEVWLTDETTGLITTAKVVGATSYAPEEALNEGDHYIWWAGAVAANNAISWGSPTTFTILPTASGPGGAALSLTPTFTWNAVAGVSTYEVWLTDQTTGQITTVQVSGTAWTPSTALNLTDSYIWWVGGFSGNTITWSSPLTFTIAPTATGPSGATSSVTPTFTWNAVSGVSTYEVWLTDQTTGQTTTATVSGTSWTFGPALNATDNYIWWVGAVNGNRIGWSSPLTFTTTLTPTAPSGAIATLTPTFTWTGPSGVSAYEVWLRDQTTGQITTALVPGTSWTSSQALNPGDSYIWWVGAVNGYIIRWSNSLTFTA